MGSYAPVPSSVVNDDQLAKIRTIAEQTVKSMADEGTPYQGVLYIGLMMAKERGGDPVVIEYNARFGDPEAEILLPSLSESGVDVADVLLQTANGNLAQVTVPQKLEVAALTVALASQGYPDSPRKGDEIMGLDKKYDGVIIQHAGTKQEGGKWLTNGGRVLYVTGVAKTIDQAAAKAYAAIGEQGVYFKDMQYRRDIGHQARSK
jgi:phosphoribosylamine--glycine ligase